MSQRQRYETPVALEVLCLPELLLCIAEFLDQYDITVCIRVSSSWYYILRPLVWRTIVVELPTTLFKPALASPPPLVYCSDSPPPHLQESLSLLTRLKSFPVSLLHDNVSHIRSYTEKVLLLQELVTLRATPLPPFKNLVHFDTLILSEPVLDLLMTNAVQRSLESLTCHSMDTRTGAGQKDFQELTRHHSLASRFWRILEKLSKLKVLKLKNAVLQEAEVKNFLRVLQQLECLELSNSFNSSFLLLEEEKYCFTRIMETIGGQKTPSSVGALPEDGFERDDSGLLMFPRLRSLTMQSNMADSAMQLEWLRHFPKLQHFHWDEMWFLNLLALARILYDPFQLAPGSLDRAFRTTLQSLDLSGTGLGDTTMVNVMDGLPNLRRLNVSGTQFGEYSARALMQREMSRKMKTISCSSLSGGGLGPLINAQEETTKATPATPAVAALESLNLKGCSEVSSKTIQAMLETFSELKEFRAMNLRVGDMVDIGSPPLETNDSRTSSSSEVPPMSKSDQKPCYFVPRPWVCHGIETLDIKFCDLAVFSLEMPPSTPAASEESLVQKLGVAQGRFAEGWIPIPVDSPGQDNSTPIPQMVDQAREIVYSQLSKLTQLVRLGLGENRLTRTVDMARPLAHNIRRMVKHPPVLDLTLDHGLEILSSLVRLEELSLQAASPRIQISDVQWMVKAWPRLRRLQGQLSAPEAHEEIVLYIKEHHPRVRIPPNPDQ